MNTTLLHYLLLTSKSPQGHSIQLALNWLKLDGSGPIDNRPYTDKLYHFVAPPPKKTKQKQNNIWYMTCDMWYVTCDLWHVKCDTWHMTCDMWHVVGWTFPKIFISLALTVCDLWMNNRALCRTATATPGLLKIWRGSIFGGVLVPFTP